MNADLSYFLITDKNAFNPFSSFKIIKGHFVLAEDQPEFLIAVVSHVDGFRAFYLSFLGAVARSAAVPEAAR